LTAVEGAEYSMPHAFISWKESTMARPRFRPVPALLSAAALLFSACGPGGGENGNGETECLQAQEIPCTSHGQCRVSSACDTGYSVCDLASVGGDAVCTTDAWGEETGNSADLSCWLAAPALPEGPAQVRMIGCVNAFGLAFDTDGGLEVSFHTLEDGLESTPLAVTTSAFETDLLGTSECEDRGAFATDAEALPTNTRLIARVRDTRNPPDFANTLRWDFVLRADEAQTVDGVATVRDDVTVIAVSTYETFPQTAGITTGIEGYEDLTDGVGNGAIAGKLHDCNGEALANVAVTIDGQIGERDVDEGGRIVFMNGTESPELNRRRTHVDGLYASLNIEPRNRTLTISAEVDGETVDLGTWEAPVLPDTVTLFNIYGLPPQ
jgi:hypothetical protein